MEKSLFLNTETGGMEPFSIRYANGLLEVLVLLFAVWTILAQCAIIAGLSFKTLSIVFSLLLPPVFILYLLFFKTKSNPSRTVPDYSVTGVLIILALIGAALAFFAIRPDADDVNYTSRAVFYLRNTGVGLDLVYRNHAPTGFNFYTPLLITQINTLLLAYLSLVFDWRFLDLYFFLGSALGGMLIPIAWYLVFSKFTENHMAAVIGAAVVVAFLCIDGGTHRSFGNFAFVRIWQGKVVLMAIVIPLFVAFSMEFFKNPVLRNWVRLFALGIASTGLSSTAIFIMPVLAISVGAGYLLSNVRDLHGLKVLAGYSTTLFYPVLIGLYCLSFTMQKYSGTANINTGWPTTFSGAYSFVFGGGLTFSSLVFYSATLLSVLLLKGSSRRFLVGWYVCVFAIFLNPLLSGMIAEHLTSANAFWRLVYILPFPLVIGIPAVALCEARLTSARHAYFLLIFLIVATMLVNTIPSDFGVFKKVEFGVFRYKIDKKIGLDAKRMADNIPDGPMLAPLRYSSIIPMFTPGLPQIAVRGFELKHFAGIHGRPKVARERLKAVAFVSGSNNKGFEAFVEVLKMGLKTVVLDSSMVGSIKARQVLLENGFTLFDEGDSYIIYVRR